MTEIHVQLPDQINSFIQDQIAAGRYPNPSEYLRDLVSADQQQQSLLNRLRESRELARQIDIGLQSDDGRHWTADVAREIKERIIRQDLTRE